LLDKFRELFENCTTTHGRFPVYGDDTFKKKTTKLIATKLTAEDLYEKNIL